MTHGPSLSLVALQRYIQQNAMLSVYHRFMTVTSLVLLGVLEICIKLLLENFESKRPLGQCILQYDDHTGVDRSIILK